jgi:hypothetical protein
MDEIIGTLAKIPRRDSQESNIQTTCVCFFIEGAKPKTRSIFLYIGYDNFADARPHRGRYEPKREQRERDTRPIK